MLLNKETKQNLTMSKIVGQTRLFIFAMATGLGEGKH